MSLADAAKTAVTEYYSTNNGFAAAGNSNYGLAASITGSSVSGVNVLASGVIQITYTSAVSSGALLDIVPTAASGSLTWTCTYLGTGATAIASGNQLSASWVPTTCRQ
ncbi:pilin [Chromobacterium sp. IIBBL 290-4]|nr:pilin [Chromobacterium sp. IIBBL 290-4]